MREKEKDRVFEKNVIKERKIEDELYAGQEKFITKAYRDKLEVDKKWEYENELEHHFIVRIVFLLSFPQTG
jgi:hypothetical protein